MSEELKACPFCGGEVTRLTDAQHQSPTRDFYCASCGCSFVWLMKEKCEVDAARNTRPAESPRKEQGEGTQGALEQREALAWALLPPREWDSYDRERAKVHQAVLAKMHAALASQPQAAQVEGELERAAWRAGALLAASMLEEDPKRLEWFPANEEQFADEVAAALAASQRPAEGKEKKS